MGRWFLSRSGQESRLGVSGRDGVKEEGVGERVRKGTERQGEQKSR